jgi:hypothetical protein
MRVYLLYKGTIDRIARLKDLKRAYLLCKGTAEFICAQ